MEVNMTQVCQFLRNWFVRDTVRGTFSVSGGALKGNVDILPGQYYRIRGSVMNEGVHQKGKDNLTDEPEFSGEICLMAVPPDLISLLADINEWVAAVAVIAAKPYQSESFQGYSYTMKSGGAAKDGMESTDWQSHFYARLSQWRKI
jgi:hypothetical protein